MDDPDAELRRARIVNENLAARVGALTAENLDLLVRIHDLDEQLAAVREELDMARSAS
jgi:hypothetical protein